MTRHSFALSFALLVATFLAAACGDDDTQTADAATADAVASTDARSDASATSACETMCSCAVVNCTGFSMQTCLTDCAALPASVTACRREHCGYAKSNPTFHCPHVAGTAGSTGVPDACLDN